MSPFPLSILDLAVVADGATSSDALAATEAAALQADRLGYTRLWVAEHHNLPGVASTTPSVLIAHLAARTSRIRVGSGGVMLPNHPPLAVAEQFALLEALHPGRIDLGIGRAPGTDPRTAAALRRSPAGEAVDAFPQDLIQVMGLLGDIRAESGPWDRLTATPRATSTPTVMLLGSSGYSAQLAGMLGLPFAYAHHFETGYTAQAVDFYRDSFRPSPVLSSPYAIVTVAAMTGATAEEAEYFARPALLRRYGLQTGRRLPLLSPDDAARHPELENAEALSSNRIVGETDAVIERLRDLAQGLAANELMLAMPTHGTPERLANHDRIAAAWQLPVGNGQP